MGTFDITFFLITQFYVYKMDADLRKRRRNISQREQRWSMNSQRLEEIVAELMKPISDVRRSFDTDLSALLEEYLTEAGLHALAAAERSQPSQSSSVTPNFAELALLLQQSASIYGRKVDCLYAHVLCVSDALHDNTQESSGALDEPLTPSAGRRKRKASASGDFATVALEPCAGARREALPPRPPPTLPRMYVELEPRVVAPGDVPLTDYTGEPIGLLGDFLVSRRLEGGLLVDELARGGDAPPSALRPAPLLELQAALRAASPPSPGSLPETPPVTPAPPSPPPLSPPPAAVERPPPPAGRRERKRHSEGAAQDAVDARVQLIIGRELLGKLRRVEEFSVPARWVSRVVAARAASLRAARRRRRASAGEEPEFRGFDISDSIDVGGFMGWSGSEAAAAVSLSAALRGEGASGGGRGASGGAEARRAEDSDDDGFFEQSSLGDSDTSRADDTAATAPSVRIPCLCWCCARPRSPAACVAGAAGRRLRVVGLARRRAGAQCGGGGARGGRGGGGARGAGRRRRAGAARPRRRRAGAARRLRRAAGRRRRARARRVQAVPLRAVPGQLRQHRDSAGPGAVSELVLGARAVVGRAPVPTRRGAPCRRGAPRRRAARLSLSRTPRCGSCRCTFTFVL